MEIKLKGWSSEGFRCPDVNIDLSNRNRVADISFIQMPNGTGKTTTLLLLNACLSGNISSLSTEDIYQLKKKNSTINEGRFTTNLLVNNEILSIELVADFTENKISFWTIAPKSGGKQRGRIIPNILERFLNDEFIKLFIFDGELAGKLLNSKYNEASKAIDALFQLYLIDEINIILNDYWVEKTKDIPRKSQQAVTIRTKNLNELREREKTLDNKYSNANNKRASNESKIKDINVEIVTRVTEVEEFREEYNDALRNLEAIKSKILIKSQLIFQLLRNPAISLDKKY